MKNRDLELYVHIPFCVKKCAYCDFLSAPADEFTKRNYVDALVREILEFPKEKTESAGYRVVSVFFGGGTPSILPADWIREILEALEKRFGFRSVSGEDIEITLECNPGTADAEKLCAFRAMGINRLSLGLQSASDQELKLLGRIHTWERFLDTYQEARKAGFCNINVDLMSALPGQTVSSWDDTLKRVLALKPEHISAYSLIIEEGTPFYEKYAQDVSNREAGKVCQYLPSEEAERAMYELTEQRLLEAGLKRYEISNYALPGYECRHNCGYWIRTDYAGFGLGASSLLQETRYRNTDSLSSYIKGDYSVREEELLSTEDQMEEFMFLGLRMTEGVSAKRFKEYFGTEISEIYGPVLSRLTGKGLIGQEHDRISLTPKGRDLANMVMAEFLF